LGKCVDVPNQLTFISKASPLTFLRVGMGTQNMTSFKMGQLHERAIKQSLNDKHVSSALKWFYRLQPIKDIKLTFAFYEL